MRYGKAYGGADPELIEGDIFRIIIQVPEFGANGNTTRFYGADGSPAGRADASGKTVRFYGKDGAAAGRADR